MYTLYTGESNVTHCAVNPAGVLGGGGGGHTCWIIVHFHDYDKPLSWWVMQRAL